MTHVESRASVIRKRVVLVRKKTRFRVVPLEKNPPALPPELALLLA